MMCNLTLTAPEVAFLIIFYIPSIILFWVAIAKIAMIFWGTRE